MSLEGDVDPWTVSELGCATVWPSSRKSFLDVMNYVEQTREQPERPQSHGV